MKYNCLVCNHEWNPKSYPFKCPKCKNSNWDFGSNISCTTCGRTVLNPVIHHVDGVHKNNTFTNRVPLCTSCHHAIHTGFGKNGKRLRDYGVKKVYIKKNEFEGKEYSRLIFSIHNRKDSVNYEKLVNTIKNIQFYQAHLKGIEEVEKIKIFNLIDIKNKKREKEIFKSMSEKNNLNKEKLPFIEFFTANKNDSQIFKLMVQKEKENNYG